MARKCMLSMAIFALVAAAAMAGPYENALAQFKAGQYAYALGTIDAFLNTLPADFALKENCHFLRLQCLWELKTNLPMLDRAATEFLIKYPANPHKLQAAYYRAAVPSLQIENWIAARNALAEFLTVYGSQESEWKDAAQADLVRAMIGCGDFEQAKQFVAQTLTARPDHPRRMEMRFEAAMADFKNENYPAAAERFQQLVADAKQSTGTLAQNARLYSGLAKYHEALQAENAKNDPRHAANLFTEALERFADTVALAPDVADEARYTRALILKLQGDTAGYEAAAKEISVQIAYQDAMAFKTRSDWQGLKIALTNFLAAQGETPSKWKDVAELDLAEARNKLSEYEAVRQYVAKTLDDRPDHPRRVGLMTESAVATYKSQRWNAAIQEFERLEGVAADDDYYDAFAKFLGGAARLEEANRLTYAQGASPQSAALRAAGKAKLATALNNGKLPIKFRVDVLYHMDEHARMKAAAEEYLSLPEKATSPLVRTSMMDWLGVEYAYQRDFAKSKAWFDKVIEEYKRNPQDAAGIPATHSVLWGLWLRNEMNNKTDIKNLLNTLVLMPDDEFRSPLLWENRRYFDELTIPMAVPKAR